MCGIAGYLGPRLDDAEAVADTFRKLLKHRGPDSEGTRITDIAEHPGRQLILAHTRLSIIDPDPAADQPMQDGGSLIVMNGEIYNYRSLRRGLESGGISFETQSDTEVLLKGLGARGHDFLLDLVGMYAFARWNAAAGEMLLAVDPAGIKPLYYWTGPGGRFLFASELRALLATGLVPKRLDPIALEGYLGLGAVQAPHTMIQGVRSLLPGQKLVVGADGKAKGPQTYYSLGFRRQSLDIRPQEAAEKVRELFRISVKDHLVSDVPVGVLLSGGVDSSAIVAEACRQNADIKTFSVIFSEAKYSEASYSKAVAEKYQLDHAELHLSVSELLGMLPGALDSMDSPTLDGINVYAISKAVHETGIKTVLSGQGGDEVFAGYRSFRNVAKARNILELLSLLPGSRQLLRHLWRFLQSLRHPFHDKISEVLSGDDDAYSLYCLWRQVYPHSFRRMLLPEGGPGTDSFGMPAQVAHSFKGTSSTLDTINAISFLELRAYLANTLLRDGDFMSMAHGLEIRTPMLDRRLVNFVVSLRGAMKLDGAMPKRLLLQAVDGSVPETVWRRPKQGFTLPWENWMRGKLRPLCEETIHDDAVFRSLGMSPAPIHALWKDYLQCRPGITWARIWALVALSSWARKNLL